MNVISNNHQLLYDFTSESGGVLSPNDDFAPFNSPASMDSGFSSGSNAPNLSPSGSNFQYELQYQHNPNELSPLTVHITSPAQHSAYSPASDTSSSAVQYLNLNEANLYSPLNNYGNQQQMQQSSYVYTSTTTVPTNDYAITQKTVGQPYLQMVEQTTREFRFRYKSEMNGPHGNLMGIKSSKNEKTYPTVALRNYNAIGPIKIRCSLYQIDENVRRLHSHKLVIKNGDFEKSDPHDFSTSDKQNYTVRCEGMGIIRNPRPQIKAELCRKKSLELEFEMNRKPTAQEMKQIEKESEDEAKTMNLNQVRLRFDALRFNDQFQRWERICEPIYSNIINDTKSAKTGQLKICRMSRDVSLASGGDEVFLFVEKVCKDDIKVRFFEGDEDDRIWESEGIFDETCVHHQFGIVLKTPPYKDENITAPVDVFMELYRPSSNCVSAPLPFKYKPNPRPENSRKRARRNSVEIPTVVSMHEKNNQQINNNNSEIGGLFGQEGVNFNVQDYNKSNNNNTESLMDLDKYIMELPDFGFLNEMKSDDLLKMIDPKFDSQTFNELGLEIDGASNYDSILIVLDKIKILERIFRNDYEEMKMKALIWELIEKQTDSDNILFDAIERSDSSKVQDLVMILYKYKFSEILLDTTAQEETCLHLVIKTNKINLIKLLTCIGLNVNKGDIDGNTPLHLAVNENRTEAVIELIKAQNQNAKQNILLFDTLNDDGFSALHIAARNQNLDMMKILIDAGASIYVKNPRTGNNILQTLIENGPCSKDIVKYLIDCDDQLVTEKNGSDFDAIDLAIVKKFPDDVIDLLKGTTNDPSVLLQRLSIIDHKEEIKETPQKIFDEECLNDLSSVLDKDEKWKSIASLMGFENFFADWKTSQSPTTSMLKQIESEKRSLEDLVTMLELVDERALINSIDEMIVRKMQR